MNIIGIDPGLSCTGVACYDEIEGMRTVSIRPTKELRFVERMRYIAEQIRWASADLLVLENQQIYHTTPNPNDIIKLSILTGHIAAQFDCTILLPKPAEWKGQVPKKIHHARIRKRVPNLNKRMSQDAMDAVGLCLYGVDYARSTKRF